MIKKIGANLTYRASSKGTIAEIRGTTISGPKKVDGPETARFLLKQFLGPEGCDKLYRRGGSKI